MRPKKWLRGHPVIAGLLAVLSFALIWLPSAITSLWSLWSSEPFLLWIARHNLPRLEFSPLWISGPIGAGLLALILWSVRSKSPPTSVRRADVSINLVPDRWASPVLATVINRSRIFPAHLKTSVLFGVKPDAAKFELQRAWDKKFPGCITLPYTLPPDRRIQLAYPGHFPFDALTGMFAQIELENGTVVASPTIPPPKPPQCADKRSLEPLDYRDKLMVACADAIDAGKQMFWALLDVRADELTDNEDLVYICETLATEGHKNQLDSIPKSSWLYVLKKARLRPNRPRSEVELYDFICELANLRPNTRADAALTIEALPPRPNTRNLTQLGWSNRGRPPFDAFCILSVRNSSQTVEVGDIVFRLLRIEPDLVSERGIDPATDSVGLRKLKFAFDDVERQTLKPGQSAYIELFEASRLPVQQDAPSNIIVEFSGKGPAGARNRFVAASSHVMTVEVAAKGVSRVEAQFLITFSNKSDEPVFTISAISAEL
jgi:hypothetical protein